jgi:hypothetical protein
LRKFTKIYSNVYKKIINLVKNGNL